MESVHLSETKNYMNSVSVAKLYMFIELHFTKLDFLTQLSINNLQRITTILV